MNLNLLVNEINRFKAELVNHANAIALNDDTEWEINHPTINEKGDLDFWMNSIEGERDFYHTTLNIKLFQDNRVIEHHLAQCKSDLDKKKANE